MKQGILVDLTALLDVVMNLMFLVLVTTTQQMESVQAKSQADAAQNAELSMQVSQLKTDNSALARQMLSYSAFNENCLILTVSLESGAEARTIRVESDGRPVAEIQLTWENGQYARNLLKSELGQSINDAFSQKKQFVFIVFQYERSAVYQSDYRLVDGVIQEQKTYEDVYFTEYDAMEAGKDE